jgi:hypothetical protein
MRVYSVRASGTCHLKVSIKTAHTNFLYRDTTKGVSNLVQGTQQGRQRQRW